MTPTRSCLDELDEGVKQVTIFLGQADDERGKRVNGGLRRRADSIEGGHGKG